MRINARMTKIIIELALSMIGRVKSKKGVAGVIAVSVVAIVATTWLSPDMRESFVRRSSYMVNWYCDALPKDERAQLREEVNHGLGHVVLIHCDGDNGLDSEILKAMLKPKEDSLSTVQ